MGTPRVLKRAFPTPGEAVDAMVENKPKRYFVSEKWDRSGYLGIQLPSVESGCQVNPTLDVLCEQRGIDFCCFNSVVGVHEGVCEFEEPLQLLLIILVDCGR